MSVNTTFDYSPNFDQNKRKSNQIKFIIFHYTGMNKEKNAIKRLTDKKSKVSSHYFVKKNGEILSLVPNLYIAWHAGASSWKNYRQINKYSIGIEISNPGHDFKYRNFSRKQINAILKLTKYLIIKFKIQPKFILGHSDIAPDRKKDPGEKFPWRYFSENKIGISHDLCLKKLSKKEIRKLTKQKKKNLL